jgi:putative FmdB family regulatory protein
MEALPEEGPVPIYEYQCPDCGHHFEQLQKISEEPVRVCPNCSAAHVKKLVSQTSFVLKGGGWYKDHYGLKSGTGSSDGASSKSSDGSDGGSKVAADKPSSDTASKTAEAAPVAAPAAPAAAKAPAKPASSSSAA